MYNKFKDELNTKKIIIMALFLGMDDRAWGPPRHAFISPHPHP